MATGIAYPHVEKQDEQPWRLERLPRIRVAQIVMDYLASDGRPTRCAASIPT